MSTTEMGMQVLIGDAETRIRDMIDAALRGEEVTIASGSTPILRLVPVETRRFTYGIMADKLKGPVPDFLEPMSEEELRLWEGGDERHR